MSETSVEACCTEHMKKFLKNTVSLSSYKEKQDIYIRIADLKQAIEHDKK